MHEARLSEDELGQMSLKSPASHQSPAGIPGRLVQVVREEGVVTAIRRIRAFLLFKLHKHLSDRHHERYERVATHGLVDIEADMVVGANAAHGNHYSPTPRKVFKWLMECVHLDITQCTFVDYGSGRGRVLMAAAELPFKQVIGVEFARELHSDAVKNLADMPKSMKRAGSARAINADATTFEIPEGPCVLYLYNPFTGDVLDAVMERISKARASREEEVCCILNNYRNITELEKKYRLERCKLPFWPNLKLKLFAPYPYAICRVLP